MPAFLQVRAFLIFVLRFLVRISKYQDLCVSHFPTIKLLAEEPSPYKHTKASAQYSSAPRKVAIPFTTAHLQFRRMLLLFTFAFRKLDSTMYLELFLWKWLYCVLEPYKNSHIRETQVSNN